MSLFANRGRNTRIGRRRMPIENRKHGRRQVQQFADALADGAPSITAAGRQIGVGQQRASQLYAQIRRELGWQAQ